MSLWGILGKILAGGHHANIVGVLRFCLRSAMGIVILDLEDLALVHEHDCRSVHRAEPDHATEPAESVGVQADRQFLIRDENDLEAGLELRQEFGKVPADFDLQDGQAVVEFIGAAHSGDRTGLSAFVHLFFLSAAGIEFARGYADMQPQARKSGTSIHGHSIPKGSARMPHNRIFFASFLDGFTAPLRLFDTVERPGSCFAELDDMTTPDMLEAYGAVNPLVPGLLLDLKEKERKRDVAYLTLFRINGAICLLAMIAAFGLVGC